MRLGVFHDVYVLPTCGDPSQTYNVYVETFDSVSMSASRPLQFNWQGPLCENIPISDSTHTYCDSISVYDTTSYPNCYIYKIWNRRMLGHNIQRIVVHYPPHDYLCGINPGLTTDTAYHGSIEIGSKTVRLQRILHETFVDSLPDTSYIPPCDSGYIELCICCPPYYVQSAWFDTYDSIQGEPHVRAIHSNSIGKERAMEAHRCVTIRAIQLILLRLKSIQLPAKHICVLQSITIPVEM